MDKTTSLSRCGGFPITLLETSYEKKREPSNLTKTSAIAPLVRKHDPFGSQCFRKNTLDTFGQAISFQLLFHRIIWENE